MLYTNSVPNRITATLRTPPPEDSTFKVEFVAPTLGVAGTGEADAGTTDATTEGSYTYSAGGTNTWFVTVTLDSPTDVGTAFEFDLELEGFNDGRTEDCAALPDCDSDEELETANERLEQAKSELSERSSATPEALEAEIVDLEARQASLEDQLEVERSVPLGLVVPLSVVAVLAPVGALLIRRRAGTPSA